ncbi:hypothetical protein GGR58DRAFT_472302 [Xylaria digitata]|nr:hypothetical protein GGR58DRAFT_472302 [Xylaria digitata]
MLLVVLTLWYTIEPVFVLVSLLLLLLLLFSSMHRFTFVSHFFYFPSPISVAPCYSNAASRYFISGALNTFHGTVRECLRRIFDLAALVGTAGMGKNMTFVDARGSWDTLIATSLLYTGSSLCSHREIVTALQVSVSLGRISYTQDPLNNSFVLRWPPGTPYDNVWRRC